MVIELAHISKHFGAVAALQDVSLSLNPGERLALVGENGAGKSSLMNVLYGLYQPDVGEVRFDGAAVKVKTPTEALKRGVGMVHQHFTLVPTLSVAENVVLGHEPTRWGGRLEVRRAHDEVAATCARFGFSLDPAAPVKSLSVGGQQKVEIIKALHRQVKVLILDEPTAVLTPQEAEELLAMTHRLSAQGLAVVLISHKLRDVLAFSTRIAVMRQGRKVAETTPADTSETQLAELMVGQRAASGAVPTHVDPVARVPLVSVEGLACGRLRSASFIINQGEILGVAGIDSSGQQELAELLLGLRPREGGSLVFDGQPLTALTPRTARAMGIALVPEDRLRFALASDLSVEENVALGRHRQVPFARGWRIDGPSRRKHTQALLERHDVRPQEPSLRAGALSGGNQQKLVLGREIDSQPRLLIAAQPTRGLDFSAVAAVHEQLRHEAARGAAVLLLSLDLDELLALSHRLLVLRAGRVVSECLRAQFDEREIGRHMLGVADA